MILKMRGVIKNHPKHFNSKKGVLATPVGDPEKPRESQNCWGKVAKQKILTKGNNGPQWMTKIEASFTQLINQAASGHLKALDLLAKMMISFPETVKPRDVEDKVSSAKAKLLKLLEARYGSLAEGAAEPDQPSGQ